MEILSLRLIWNLTLMNKLCFVFIFICGITFSQNLEEDIYTAAETFISNKTDATLKTLSEKETVFKNQVKTKDEQLALVFLQCHKAYYLDEHLKLKEAIYAYEDALKRFNNNELSKLSDFDIIESCLKPLGNLYTKTGDFTNAVSTINQYIFLAEKSKNRKHQISGAINLAKLYQTIGKHETALKIVNDAFKLSNINSNQKALLQSIKASSLIALNKYEAGSLLNNSASKFENFKNNYILEFQKGNYESALISFKKAKECIAEANFSSRDLSKFYVEEAQLHFILKNKNDALKSLQQALKLLIPNFKGDGLPTKTSLYAENTFIDIFDLQASLESDIKKALDCYNLSFYVSALLEDNWTSQEAKILNETNNRLRSETCIDILFYNYQKTKNKSFLFEAFQYSESSKASILKSINEKKKRLKQHPNNPLLVKEFKLIKAQEHATNLLIREQLGSNQSSKINAISEQLSAISLQLKAIKLDIEKKYPETKNLYGLEKIQQKLAKDNAVLVSYFFGKNTLYQFTISKENITIESTTLTNETRKNISNFIHLFDNASIINNDIPNYTNQAFKLFKLLKLDKTSTEKNLIIIPDGLLNFVPFEALLTSKTSTISFKKMPFIIKNKTIAYNSSVQFYLTETNISKNNKLLGFFPVFENSNQKLTFSINEANVIRKEMPSNIFMNGEASKENFIKNASNYAILHLSTHASSGNFTNPANLSFYDDIMYLNELYSLDINPELVVLSACETGIGTLYKGEGAMSIARGFQYAGAENLLFTLWQINDLSTSQIMQSFYENYSKSHSAIFSNHQSKLEYLQSETISNAKKSPYYWSSFVYYGKLDQPKPNYAIFYIIFSITIGLIVLLLFLKYRKHDRNT